MIQTKRSRLASGRYAIGAEPPTGARRNAAIGIGTGVVLFVIGAILVFALNFDIGGVVNIDVIGYVPLLSGGRGIRDRAGGMYRRRSMATTTSVDADPASGSKVKRKMTEVDGGTTV